MHEIFRKWVKAKEDIIVPDRSFSEEFPDLSIDDSEPQVEGITGDLSQGFDYFYGRSGHPEYTRLENLLVKAEAPHAADHGQVDAAVFSSGMGAVAATLNTFLKMYDSPMLKENQKKLFVAGNTLYTSTKEILQNIDHKNFSPTVFVDTTNPDNVRDTLEANKGNVAALYFETVTNPTLAHER